MNRRAFTATVAAGGIAMATGGLAAIAPGASVAAQEATPSATTAASPSATPTADGALYRVDLPGELLPTETVVTGVVGVTMTAGTIVSYPEGASGESLVIDHVLTGGYTVTTTGGAYLADEPEPEVSIESVAVGAGETVVLPDNSAEQVFAVGNEDTTTLTMGFFTFAQGSGDSTVDGEQDAAFLAGSDPFAVPAEGVTVTIVPAGATWDDAVIVVPFETEDGAAWELVILPLGAGGTPAASPAATPAG